nr:hypothetical protein [Tanacetum cinerariifolium]
MMLTFAETHNMIAYLTKSDAKGVECLLNEEIFTELARMGYKKPSTKLKFYKAFFSSQWKFLIHTILQWVVSVADDVVPTADEEPSIPSPTPPTPPPQPSHDILSTSQEQPTPVQSPQVQPHLHQPQPQSSHDAGIFMHLFQEVMDTCTALTRRVEHLELDKIAQALEITKLKRRVKKLERRNKGRMIADLDQDADVVLEEAKDVKDDVVADDAKDGQDTDEEESEPAELQEVVDIVTTAKIITEVVTAASTTITAADVPILVASTAAALTLTDAPSRWTKKVVIRDPEESTTTTSIIIHSKAKSKDKGKGILIVPNEDDNVYTKATPLARKVPVVDYEIYNENNKPYFKIKRADEKKYPLTKFTLNQMLNNVRLKVEEESEVSLELLSFGVDAAMDFKEKHAKYLMLLVKDLMLSSQDDAVD